MIAVLEILVLALLVVGAVEPFARWHEAREERRQRLLEESWALYRASRRIHDETAAALQSMLDEARRTRPGVGE